MAETSKQTVTNEQLAAKLDQLSVMVAQLSETTPKLIRGAVDELAESTQRGFTGMQESFRKEMSESHEKLKEELRLESQAEHEETRKLIADKADLYEVVKRPEFDRLEQRVTQLELR